MEETAVVGAEAVARLSSAGPSSLLLVASSSPFAGFVVVEAAVDGVTAAASSLLTTGAASPPEETAGVSPVLSFSSCFACAPLSPAGAPLPSSLSSMEKAPASAVPLPLLEPPDLLSVAGGEEEADIRLDAAGAFAVAAADLRIEVTGLGLAPTLMGEEEAS